MACRVSSLASHPHLHKKPLPRSLRIVTVAENGGYAWGLGFHWRTPNSEASTSHFCKESRPSPAMCRRTAAQPTTERQLSLGSLCEGRTDVRPSLVLRHFRGTTRLLTSCSILEPEAPAPRHCGSRIHIPVPGTLQSSPEDPGTVSAGRQDVPSSISREGAALRQSRSVSAHECKKHLITHSGFRTCKSAAQPLTAQRW